MSDWLHKIDGIGLGVCRIFSLAGLTHVCHLHELDTTRTQSKRIVSAADKYVREKLLGLSESYYDRQRRVMVARCLRVILRVQEGELNMEMQIPEPFQCPLSFEWFVEPVVTPSGHTYSREEITNWLKTSRTDPISGDALCVEQLIPNRAMECAVDFYRRKLARMDPFC